MPTITYRTDELFSLTPAQNTTKIGAYASTPHVRYQFRNLAEFAAFIPTNMPADCLSDTAWGTDQEFTGTRDMQTAVDLANTGWHDGATQAQDAAQRLQVSRPTRNRMSRQCRVAGALPDVARAIAGNPAHMRQIKPREVSGRVITLLVDFCASGSVDHERLMLNAVCAAAVVDAMESAGFRVEVIARSPAMSEGVVCDIAVCAKRADEPLDLGNLAFICGHPGMFRRFCFALYASQPSVKELGRTLGYPGCSQHDSDAGIYAVPPAQKNLPGSTDVAEIFDGVVSALRAQGCPGLAETE